MSLGSEIGADIVSSEGMIGGKYAVKPNKYPIGEYIGGYGGAEVCSSVGISCGKFDGKPEGYPMGVSLGSGGGEYLRFPN